MSDVNTNKKSEFNIDDIDTGSISSIINMIIALFNKPKPPVVPLPPALILSGANLRPGVSASEIASRIITRQTDAGLVVGNVFADNANKSEAMEVIRIEEIINAILNEAKVEIVIPPGITVQTLGIINPSGSVTSYGTTTSIAVGSGVLR